jgi:hypothetical protein
MTKHDRVEHELPNGDLLIVDATDIRPEVQKAFAALNAQLDRVAEETYRRLREAIAA